MGKLKAALQLWWEKISMKKDNLSPVSIIIFFPERSLRYLSCTLHGYPPIDYKL